MTEASQRARLWRIEAAVKLATTAVIVIVAFTAAATVMTSGHDVSSEAGVALRSTLYEQAVARVWQQSVPAGVSYLLLEDRESRLVIAQWPDNSEPVAPGSLIKPFTALAYARGAGGRYPKFDCIGRETCWLPEGHGRLDLPHAVAFSCNAYFAQLASAVSAEAWDETLREFALPQPRDPSRLHELTGVDTHPWVSPLNLARAYCALVTSPPRPGTCEVLEGMALSAKVGTGRALDRAIFPERALVKTGTGPCVHTPRGAGDGYAMVLWPAETPRFALLVRVHNRPGSIAAATAGQMIRSIARGR